MSVSAGSTPVAELTENAVVTVPPQASLASAAQRLVDRGIGALVVGDHAHVVGVLSERDIVRAVAEGRDVTATPVEAFAQSTLVWCDVTATVVEVAAEMLEHYVRHVLVERNGSLCGIVSARDLLGAYTAADMDLD